MAPQGGATLLHPNHFPRPSLLNNTSQTSRKRSERPKIRLAWVVLVNVGAVVVLTTGHTTTTGALAVLADTTFKVSDPLLSRTFRSELTVTGRDVTPVLARLRETGRHLALVVVEGETRRRRNGRQLTGRNRDRRTSQPLRSKLLPQQTSTLQSNAFQHACPVPSSQNLNPPSCRVVETELEMSLLRQKFASQAPSPCRPKAR